MSAAVETPLSGDAKQDSPVDLSTIPVSPNGADKTKEQPAASSDEQITVFHNPENFNVKHPLMHKWTLWFTKPPSGKVELSAISSLCTLADCA